MKMKTTATTIGGCLLAATVTSQAAVVYSDDFTGQTNGGAYNPTGSSVSPSGIPALEAYGSTINARINVERLQLDDGGPNSEGLAFGGTAGRYNWATSPFAAGIISDGLQIDFDARTSNGGDFISLGFGSFTGVPSGGADAGFGAIYGYSDMDWGYRAENDRAIAFLADDTTSTSVIETYSVGNFNWYHVTIDLQFTDFNLGSTVNATATVYDGQGTGGSVVSSINDSFTLGATDNFVFDFSVNENGSEVLMDNIAISAVPEPSIALLGGLGLLGLLRRRRA